MLRGLLRDSEAAKALFEKVGLFKTPELLEKYLIASEVTVEVLDLFLSRILGTERASIEGGDEDLKAILESFCSVSLSDQKGSAEKVSARTNEPNKEVEGLRVKVQDLERQLCAVQRQLQMQGEVSQLAASLDGRLAEVADECDRRMSDMTSQLSAVSNEALKGLSEEVSRLKEGERSLGDRLLSVEQRVNDGKRALREEFQGEIERLDAAVKTVQRSHRNIPYDARKPLDGVIAELTRECGGNVHEKGAVEVTANTVYYGHEAKNVVDLGTNPHFASSDEPNSWIRYDFKGRRVAPTSYSIRTHDCIYPKSWVLEVSNDGSDGSWTIVDRRENSNDLNAGRVTRNFAISTTPCGSFQFVRLRQIGKTHSDNYLLVLTSLELFGTLYW